MTDSNVKNICIFLPLGKTSVDREFFETFNIAKTFLLQNRHLLPFNVGAVFDYYCHTFPIDANRNECVLRIIKGIEGSDGRRIFPDVSIWLDTDQTFQPDSLFNLLKHDKPIVAGVYYLKATRVGRPFYPVLFKKGKNTDKTRLYRPIIDYPEDGTLFEVDFLGMGCVAIKREVFLKLKMPYFKYMRHPKNSPSQDSQFKYENYINDVSEDAWFWKQVREKTDYKILVDGSIQCGHIGRIIYTHEMFKTYRDTHKKLYVEKYGEAKYNEEWDKVCKVSKEEAVKSAS